MRRLLLATVALGVCLLAGAAAVSFVFLRRPEALLTSRRVGAAFRRFGESWSPRWSRLEFTAKAFERRRHRYVLSAADLCVDDRKGVFSACFSEFELSAVVHYSWRGPVLERIERLVAVSESARVDLRKREPKRRPSAPLAGLRAVSVDALRVELARFTVASATTTIAGAFRLALTPGVRRPFSAQADVQLRGPGGARRLKTELTADTDLLKGRAPTYVDIVGRAEWEKRGRVKAAFRIRRESLRYVVSGSADLEASSGPLRSVRLTACDGSAPWSPGAARPSGAALACRYELALANPAVEPFGGIKAAKGGVSLSARLDGEQAEATLKANVDPIVAWYELAGDLAVRAGGRLDRPLSEATASHELRVKAKVPRFEDLVAVLRGQKYAIPMPIHIMKGPLSLSLESRGDSLADRQTVHYEFGSDLAASRQRLVLRATGDLAVLGSSSPARSFEHSGELILKEVALELPRLDIERAPKVFGDKRIKSGVVAAPSLPEDKGRSGGKGRPPALKARLSVKTEKPLLLFSNLAKDPVPISLDLVAAYPPAVTAGRVSVDKFTVELFRRNATIHHLNVILSSGSKVGELEGLIVYATPSATINILLLGTTAKPRIEFTSVPPMKREDILALLIFGKSPDDLDLEQTASVTNTETALESRAFGLASLYLFGATPVEHVGYDSGTKTASVKLRLPGGANLVLGSDFDQSRELRLRKLLAPHWAIQSEITDQGQESRAATTFLEWFNRY